MRCPKCQADVPEGHFYCPNCHVSVYGYVPEGWKSNSGRLERAGRRLLDMVLLLALIGGGVVLARAIKWKELLNGFNSSAEISPSAKPGPSGHPPKHRAAKTPSEAPNKSSDEASPGSKPKIEEPPSKTETQPTAKPAATPTPKPNPQ